MKKKKFEKKKLWGPNIHQAKSGVISKSLYRGRGVRGPKIKVAQSGVKHDLILEFLRSNDICEISCLRLTHTHTHTHTNIHTDGHHSDQINHSAQRAGVTKNSPKIDG